MNGTNGESYGSRFERAFVGLLAPSCLIEWPSAPPTSFWHPPLRAGRDFSLLLLLT